MATSSGLPVVTAYVVPSEEEKEEEEKVKEKEGKEKEELKEGGEGRRRRNFCACISRTP